MRETALLALQDPEDALEIVNDFLRRDPCDVEALGLKGNILEWLDADDDARKCYDEILQIDPTNARALIDIAGTYLNTDDPEACITFSNRALALLSGSYILEVQKQVFEDAIYIKVEALRDMDRKQDAIACLQEALSRVPDSEHLLKFLEVLEGRGEGGVGSG